MPSMKKKNNYESPGLVRRFLKKGASFRSLGGGESLNNSFSGNSFGRFGTSEGKMWRPRKNQFELLDGDDEDSLSVAFQQDDSSSWNIQPVISSSESEPGEYRRGIMFEKKATALKKTPVKMRGVDRKRELSPIKPPYNDTSSIRLPTSSAKKPPQKIQRNDNEYQLNCSISNTTATSDDIFSAPTTDSFGFEMSENKNTISSHIEKSKKSRQTFPLTSHNSVVSDPTDFFSKEQIMKLTMGNLAKIESTPKTTSTLTATCVEKLVKERKFYQFAVDEDKTSTVVESTIKLPADYPGGDYSIDETTEMSCDETSQGTRIQQHSVTSHQKEKQTECKDIIATSSHSRRHANEVKEFDAFFPDDIDVEKGRKKKLDEFFPPNTDKDGFLPGFVGARQAQTTSPPTPGTDLSLFGGDKYFDSHHTPSDALGQASIKSLAYSISPVHQKKTPAVVAQNVRQPLSSRNPQPSSGKKSNEWFAPKNSREHEAQFQFDDFPPPPSASKKKRQASISSSNFQPPPADPFRSSPIKFGAKENNAVKVNRHEDLNDSWGKATKQHHQSLQRNNRLIVRNIYDDTDSDEDDDAFDDVGNWERPAPTSIGKGVMVQNRTFAINRARISRQSHESYNRPSKNRYIDDDYDDDVRSVASGFEVARTSSASKPTGLPSNAIMASMLFQTQQYGIDQSDVTAKINAIEQENSRQKKVRTSQGGIPDAVDADDDYMTTVSSFSDATSAYLQEPWRKPSSDLMNHFTGTRALDMEYRRYPVRTQRPEPRPQRVLYEA